MVPPPFPAQGARGPARRPGGSGRNAADHEDQVSERRRHLDTQYEIKVERFDKQPFSVHFHSDINHTFVEYFKFWLNASFFHDLCKIEDRVVRIDKDIVSAEIQSSAIKRCKFRSRYDLCGL